MTRKVN